MMMGWLLGIIILCTGCGRDTEPPVIRLNAPDTLIWSQRRAFEPSAIAFDKRDLDLSSEVQVSPNLDVNRVGTYHVVYSVADKAGNTAETEQTVIVQRTLQSMLGYYRSTSNCSNCPNQGRSRIFLTPGISNYLIIKPTLGDSSSTNTSSLNLYIGSNLTLYYDGGIFPCNYILQDATVHSDENGDSIFVNFERRSSVTSYCTAIYVRE